MSPNSDVRQHGYSAYGDLSNRNVAGINCTLMYWATWGGENSWNVATIILVMQLN